MSVGSSEPHVVELLGLYYLDVLDPAQGDGIERHLSGCDECRAAAAETCETVAALALVGEQERGELLDSFGALNRVGPPPEAFVRFFAPEHADPAPGPVTAQPGRVAPRPVEQPREPSKPAPAEDKRAREPEPRRVRPQGRTDASRPARPRSRTRALAGTAVLFAVVVLFAGIALTALIRGSGDTSSPAPFVTVAATAADTATGVSVSIVANEESDGVAVHATVNGLLPGTGYRLHVSTKSGTALPVVNWTGTGKAQDVSGTVHARLAELAFFTVTQVGKGPVVSVYLSTDGSEAPGAAPAASS